MASQSTNGLRKVYRYSENITKTRGRIVVMLYTEQNRGTTPDKSRSNRMARLRVRLNRLTLMRRDEIMKVYSNLNGRRDVSPRHRSAKPRKSLESSQQRPTTAPYRRRSFSPSLSPSPPQSVTPSRSPSPSSPEPDTPSRSSSPIAPLIPKHIDVKPDKTVIDMVPASFKSYDETDDDESGEEENDDDTDIVYPEGVTDRRPYQTIARYRRTIGESTNFREQPLCVGEDSTETLVLGLESFAQQHGCDLSFTNEDQQFDKSIYRAACGVADLGSIHLLATDSLLTASFEFEVDLDYDNDITSSKEAVENFVLDFCNAISEVLSCDNSNIRVFSINKPARKSGRSHVNFGLTTSDQKRTQTLADKLQSRARSGFSDETILKHVKAREYEYTWKPVLNHLQIRPQDLDSRYNFDYRKPGVPVQDIRGGYPYYLPISWFRHGLNVSTKYGADKTWIGQINAEGEWPIAFHGTKKEAVDGIIQKGLLPSAAKRDAMLAEAIQQIGKEAADRPGLYVATHCDGGSHPQYTTSFTVTALPNKSETFNIVFQCRVQPGKFTIHKSPVKVGEAWRIVDPNAVRPYGILLRKE